MPRRRGSPCRGQPVNGCQEESTELRCGFCEWCWEQLPDDIQERLIWAFEYGNQMDKRAARAAARASL